MANLFDWKAGKYNALMGKIAEHLTPEKGERLLANPELIREMVGSIKISDHNPFALSVEEQLRRLHQASEEGGWDLSEYLFKMLAKKAPDWPEGHLAFRSFRIRFGSGDEGVAETFEAHVDRIKSVFGPKFFWRDDSLLSDQNHLRLLVGNQTHQTFIDWVIFDLGAHRKRKSVKAVRGPQSLADEGLVFAWMFPEYVRAIDHQQNPAFFLAGYELDVPKDGREAWRHVPSINSWLGEEAVGLHANLHGGCRWYDSVPTLR